MEKGEIKYGSKEQNVMDERMESKVKKPFKIEESCIKTAWMGKDCPFYPYNYEGSKDISKDICKRLLSEEYDGYRCPVSNLLENFAPKIVEEGTEEQKKALENLADMYVLKGLEIGFVDDDFLEEHIRIILNDAERIYRLLGLEDKAKDCDKKTMALRSH